MVTGEWSVRFLLTVLLLFFESLLLVFEESRHSFTSWSPAVIDFLITERG